MTPLAFLRSAPAQELLERAQRAAGVPLSLHYLERNQEGLRVAGWGDCEACAFVSKTPGGAQACRQSRQTVSGMAVRQGRALPFVCHMGFSCVSVPALEGEGFVLTFGPYCPSEEARSLPYDALAGLKALLEANDPDFDEELAEFPVSLGDIHRAPAAAVPEIAAWTVESLRARWREAQAVEVDTSEAPVADELVEEKKRARRRTGQAEGLEVAELVAAVAASDFKLARTLLASALSEAQRGKRYDVDRASARAVSVLSATLEGLEASRMLNPAAWEVWPETQVELRELEEAGALLDACVRFLRTCQRRQKRSRRVADTGSTHAAVAMHYAALNRIITERLPERLTLEEVARELGETPSAITHRLQRKFGMSYSEYLGRLRVDQAKELLRRTQLSATEVARRVGIRDQSNFGKVFKKYAGMTPLAYRRMYGRK